MGIDPGVTGGVVVLDADGAPILSTRTPVVRVGTKRTYDIPGMVGLLEEALTAAQGKVSAVIEKVGTMPRDGRVGAFNFGVGYGLWLGILSALGISYYEVTPQRWQADMLAGLPRGDKTKLSSITRCQTLFPGVPIKAKADHGIADAALLAEYARRQHLGGR